MGYFIQRLHESAQRERVLIFRNIKDFAGCCSKTEAGLLTAEKDDAYYEALRLEYAFLQKKYGLKPVDGFLFKRSRTRPVNFPHLRLAQLASVWTHNDTLFSEILENPSIEKLQQCFNVPPSTYWDTHYHFDFPSPARKKPIGLHAAYIVMINTVASVKSLSNKSTVHSK